MSVAADGGIEGVLSGGFDAVVIGAFVDEALRVAVHGADLDGVCVAENKGDEFLGTLRLSRRDASALWATSVRLLRPAPGHEGKP